MAITNATRLSDFAAGIGTEGAILQIDNANQRIGIGTQLPSQMLEVAGIVTATAFHGDGSLLEGIKSAGLGTAIGDSNTVEEVIYYTDDLLTVAETTTVNPPASASAAYTQYRDVKLNDSVDLIIETGDDFIPDILGFGDDTSDPNAAGNGVFDEVYTNIIKNKNGLGAPAFGNGLTSVGVITATGGFSGNVTGNVTGTASNASGATGDFSIADKIIHIGDTNTSLRFPSADTITAETGGSERLRIGSAGQLGLAGANYGTSGQVMTSQGASAAPQWADAAGGAWTLLSTTTITSSTEIEVAIPQDAAYDEYAIRYINVGYQAGTAFRCRAKMKIDGTLVSGNNYQAGSYGRYVQANGNAAGGGASASSHLEDLYANNNDVYSVSGTLFIVQPTNNLWDKGVYWPQMYGQGDPGSGTGSGWIGSGAAHVNDTKTNDLTHFTIFSNTGAAWDTGKVKLYGIS